MLNIVVFTNAEETIRIAPNVAEHAHSTTYTVSIALILFCNFKQ